MKRIIRTSQTVQADFVANNPFNNLSIEILPSNKIRIHNGRHIESINYMSTEDIPETVYEYLKKFV